ncbi:MAG: 3-isopropylmalate dehydratase small subunit [Hydrogenophilus sp.]|nr:3-isopropylmalate dehydratase small subunit [Hydrogenophilus sp.]
MRPFTVHEGLVAPLDRANVDTDAIIPKQFLKSIRRSGFGPYLFDEWRYLDRGEPGMDCRKRPKNEAFVLNDPRYAGATILLTRENFGCGSSREHAAWALVDFGFRAIVAPSFADIFYDNALKNGLLLVVLEADIVERLFEECKTTPGYQLRIDLPAQTVTTPEGEIFSFAIDPHRKECLLNGWDEIGLTLRYAEEIRAFEKAYRARFPFYFIGEEEGEEE